MLDCYLLTTCVPPPGLMRACGMEAGAAVRAREDEAPLAFYWVCLEMARTTPFHFHGVENVHALDSTCDDNAAECRESHLREGSILLDQPALTGVENNVSLFTSANRGLKISKLASGRQRSTRSLYKILNFRLTLFADFISKLLYLESSVSGGAARLERVRVAGPKPVHGVDERQGDNRQGAGTELNVAGWLNRVHSHLVVDWTGTTWAKQTTTRNLMVQDFCKMYANYVPFAWPPWHYKFGPIYIERKSQAKDSVPATFSSGTPKQAYKVAVRKLQDQEHGMLSDLAVPNFGQPGFNTRGKGELTVARFPTEPTVCRRWSTGQLESLRLELEQGGTYVSTVHEKCPLALG
ncbi:hypothetical protein DFH07DRAFT_779729 [Mycena maculata]|uniref:Uncharacterized protein n=1 Tax=Mycena maculata TaxID=230809 RepID=A0AAD7I6V9_9AGAR|nr:hypothetical protein DFH07DRAFT_779729 [Mycena maculata]